VKSGYTFAAAVSGTAPFVQYTATGVPTVVGQSGQRGFYSDQSGVIRYDAAGAAPHKRQPGALRGSTWGLLLAPVRIEKHGTWVPCFFICVPSMSDSWEVQVLFTTRWR